MDVDQVAWSCLGSFAVSGRLSSNVDLVDAAES
jgi:hypothetical protein